MGLTLKLELIFGCSDVRVGWLGRALRGALALVLALGPQAQGQGTQTSPLSAAWQAVGPGSVVSAAYGKVSGRVTAVAIDPADATGNTVYVGTTGGGVWKSVNAAGPVTAVSFVPLTDDLGVFSGGAAIPSLSIGALSVQNGVVLAGTGDPNDATDSYYGSGVLRSADGGLTWTLAQGSHDGVSGNHTFAGMGFAGFAWSGTVPGLVVAGVSDAAEARLVNGVDAANAVRGPYYSTDSGVTWQMATVMDGSRVVQGPNSAMSLGGRECGDGGGVERGAAALLHGAAVQRLLRIGRWDDVDAAGGTAGGRTERGNLPVGIAQLSAVSRGAGRAGGDGRHVRAHGGCEQSRPGALAGCVRCEWKCVRGYCGVWDAAGRDGAGGGGREYGYLSGGL
jgi:hypothetical protein